MCLYNSGYARVFKGSSLLKYNEANFVGSKVTSINFEVRNFGNEVIIARHSSIFFIEMLVRLLVFMPYYFTSCSAIMLASTTSSLTMASNYCDSQYCAFENGLEVWRGIEGSEKVPGVDFSRKNCWTGYKRLVESILVPPILVVW